MSSEELSKLSYIAETAKLLIKLGKQQSMQSIKSGDMHISERARGKAREDANYLGSIIERNRHELHCLCVEAGVADYNKERYGERFHKINGWTEHKVLMREPKI